MHSEPPSPISPSPMAQLLRQLALDDLPPTTPSKDSLDSSTKTLTEEPESLGSSPTAVDFPSLLTNSRDSTLTAESGASSPGASRDGSSIIVAGPRRNASTTSLHKSVETLPVPPVPHYDPIKNYRRSLHTSASSPTLQRGTSILRSPSYTDQSAPASSPPSPTSTELLNVKFAPLPEIERPKKRKRNHTLGVAARSQMLARRRQMLREEEEADRPPKNLWRSDDDDDGEDPLVALGHMVKLASIGIWRKVASKDRKARPGMQERSNSDSVLEVTRPVSHPDDEDANKVLVDVDEPVEDTSDDKPSPPQTEITAKTVDDDVVVVQTQVASTDPIPTKEQ